MAVSRYDVKKRGAADLKKHKNDIILLVVIIAVAGLVWLGITLTRTEGAYVSVTVAGELYGTYPLDTDAEIRIGEDEDYNVLIISEGKAQISEASCPDKLCVKQGAIQYDGQSIICLPHKLVIEIKGGESSDIDAVAK